MHLKLRPNLCVVRERRKVFSSVNEGNPLSNTNRYARTYNLIIYPSNEEILEQNNIVVGMIDQCGDLYMCMDQPWHRLNCLAQGYFDSSSG